MDSQQAHVLHNGRGDMELSIPKTKPRKHTVECQMVELESKVGGRAARSSERGGAVRLLCIITAGSDVLHHLLN